MYCSVVYNVTQFRENKKTCRNQKLSSVDFSCKITKIRCMLQRDTVGQDDSQKMIPNLCIPRTNLNSQFPKNVFSIPKIFSQFPKLYLFLHRILIHRFDFPFLKYSSCAIYPYIFFNELHIIFKTNSQAVT